MQFELRESDIKVAQVNDSDDEEEENEDQVVDLISPPPKATPKHQVRNSFFDNNLPEVDEKENTQKPNFLLRLSQAETLVVEKKVSKVHEILSRAS